MKGFKKFLKGEKNQACETLGTVGQFLTSFYENPIMKLNSKMTFHARFQSGK